MEHIISLKNEKIQKEEWAGTFYRLFWIYVICGVGGFLIDPYGAGLIFMIYEQNQQPVFPNQLHMGIRRSTSAFIYCKRSGKQ